MKTTSVFRRPLFLGKTAAFATLAAGLLFGVSSARATSYTWNGSAGDGLWATATNWTSSGVPGVGDTVTFNSAGNGSTAIDLGSGVTISTITFDNSSGTLGNYTLGGGAVGSETLAFGQNNTGIVMNANVVTNQLVNAEIIIGSGNRVTANLTNNSASAILTVAGPVTAATGTGTGAESLQVNGAGSVYITGVISNNGSNAVAVSKGSTGTLTLSGANTFTGNLSITGGTVAIANSGASGTGTILVGNNTAVTTSSLLTTGAYTVSNTILVQGNSTLTVGGNQTSGTSTYSGPVNLTYQANTTVAFSSASGGTVNFTGAISGNTTGNLTIAGGGIVKLSGANTFTTGLTLSGGTLETGSSTALGNGATVTIAGGTLSSLVNMTGVGSITFSSGGLALNATSATLASGKTFAMTGGTWTVSIASTSSYDQIKSAGGSATFSISGGTLALTGTIDYSATYSILEGFTSGSIANLSITGYDTADYAASLSTSGVLSFASAIPEPATYGLIGGAVALLGAFWFRRRRQVSA